MISWWKWYGLALYHRPDDCWKSGIKIWAFCQKIKNFEWALTALHNAVFAATIFCSRTTKKKYFTSKIEVDNTSTLLCIRKCGWFGCGMRNKKVDYSLHCSAQQRMVVQKWVPGPPTRKKKIAGSSDGKQWANHADTIEYVWLILEKKWFRSSGDIAADGSCKARTWLRFGYQDDIVNGPNSSWRCILVSIVTI